MITTTVCLKIGSRGNIAGVRPLFSDCERLNLFLMQPFPPGFQDPELSRSLGTVDSGQSSHCIWWMHSHSLFPKMIHLLFFYLLLISNTCNQYVSLLIIDLSSVNWENSKLFQEEVRPENNSQLHGFRKFLQLI